ncbi:MAG: mycothiol system anti-sigma-R factor, partial [Brachybacterium sp.]|nr:mycothiol system anti-sigma-R factor [Brachybacterium sp.]
MSTRGEDQDLTRFTLEGAMDGELSPAQAERIAAHLGDCPECAEEVERYRRIKALLRRSCTGEAAPSSLRERIT